MITITKRVSLDFLGEEYNDSYIVLNSIAMNEYEDIVKQAQSNESDNLKAINFIIEQITKRFVSGKIKQGDSLVSLNKDDLTQLPAEVFTNLFAALSGVVSPKD